MECCPEVYLEGVQPYVERLVGYFQLIYGFFGVCIYTTCCVLFRFRGLEGRKGGRNWHVFAYFAAGCAVNFFFMAAGIVAIRKRPKAWLFLMLVYFVVAPGFFGWRLYVVITLMHHHWIVGDIMTILFSISVFYFWFAVNTNVVDQKLSQPIPTPRNK